MNRKALISIIILATFLLVISLIIRSCRKAPEASEQQIGQDTTALLSTRSDQEQASGEIAPSGTIEASESVITEEDVDRKNCFLLVSKTDYKLYVREIKNNGKDTVTVTSFPVCYAKNKGQKTRQGDNCTPECDPQHPFHISEIKDASTWCHDFHDGRGEILAYGHWFMRLDLSESFPDNPDVANNRSIGIHGSTNNESSVPGNGSEGCVRLRDEDLEILHDRYAYVGQTVIIEPYKQSKSKKQ